MGVPKRHQRTKEAVKNQQAKTQEKAIQRGRAAFPLGHLQAAADPEKRSKASQGKGDKTSFRLAKGGKHGKSHTL